MKFICCGDNVKIVFVELFVFCFYVVMIHDFYMIVDVIFIGSSGFV